MSEKKQKKISVGGQAIMEGVMMRAGQSLAMAVRRPDGTIVLEQQTVYSLARKLPFLRWPLLRGTLAFGESLVLGMKALEWSGRQALPDEATVASATPETAKNKQGEKWLLAATLGLGLAMGLLLFGVVPYYAAQWTAGHMAQGGSRITFNLINGLYKITIFLIYLWLMSWIPDLRRVFMYHGAEHKSIFSFEDGDALTLASARGKSRFHPRCSTAFLLLVMVVAILTFTLTLPRHLALPARLGGEFLFLIPISGVTYELQRLSARYCHLSWVRWLSRPGLLLQAMTTREPDAAQIEVALAALTAVLEMEKTREAKAEI